jgi:hypothetical protein
MERLLRFSVAAGLFWTVLAHPSLAQTDVPSRQHFSTGIDLSFVNTSGYKSWTEGSVGKLRYDDSSDGLVISRAFIDYRAMVTDTLEANVALELYNDNLGAIADFTEAYLEWRPVPRSANRYRLKAGAFYPRISLENSEPGWGSPYSLSSSTINTWVAEELRTFGAELSVTRRLQSLGGNQQVGLHAAVFYANDPAGSLLAWKGWSAHDRQTRFGDELPLPPLPSIEPGEPFENQDPYVAPFREIDNRPGYYFGGEWRFSQRVLLRAMHYDNRAEPTAFEDGQYAWATKFDHVGVQLSLPGDVGLVSQWMRGSTVMGPVVDGAHMVDTEYDSKFLLLTKVLDNHRLSVRYDDFEVSQNDDTDEDNNPENGHVWTIAYRFDHSENISLAAEWLSIKTHHCGWIYYGLNPTRTETQLQLSLQLRFSK